MPLDNATQPAEPSLSEADRADMEVYGRRPTGARWRRSRRRRQFR